MSKWNPKQRLQWEKWMKSKSGDDRGRKTTLGD
jgi:hypothetical protein